MGLNLQQIEEFEKQSGSGNFFSLKSGEEANVRILYNTNADIVGYRVHELGEQYKYATVKCPIESNDDSIESCAYCSKGLKPVTRVIVPLYNENKQQIEYWKKSGSWVTKDLLPYTEEVVNSGYNICGQVYKIKRQGEKLDTKYSLIPVGGPQQKDKSEFGKLLDPETELNMIKPANTEVKPVDATQASGNNQFTSTRRTADVF